MTAHQLRSRNWFGRNDLAGFVHRSWLKAEGFTDAVKRGVGSTGGFLLEFPTISLATCS